MVRRTKDLEWLKAWRGDESVKIITGVRRCGKSTLLLQYRDELIAEGVAESNILGMNFEDLNFGKLRQPEVLNQYIKDYFNDRKGPCYLLLDEIQVVEKWEEIINSLRLDKRFDIAVTGSNADDNFPKYVISLDSLDLSRDGIRHISAERFLMRQISLAR